MTSREAGTAGFDLCPAIHEIRTQPMPCDDRQSSLHSAIGQKIRLYRTMRGTTAMNLAAEAGISSGMLSKIERGFISPSLTTLESLAAALGLPMSVLFQSCEARRHATFVPGRNRAGSSLRELNPFPNFRSLANGPSVFGINLKSYHITLASRLDRIPDMFRSGIEFLHMLEGEMAYGHGDKLYHMSAGDSLFFDAGIRHSLVEPVSLPVRLLAVISHGQNAMRALP